MCVHAIVRTHRTISQHERQTHMRKSSDCSQHQHALPFLFPLKVKRQERPLHFNRCRHRGRVLKETQLHGIERALEHAPGRQQQEHEKRACTSQARSVATKASYFAGQARGSTAVELATPGLHVPVPAVPGPRPAFLPVLNYFGCTGTGTSTNGDRETPFKLIRPQVKS